MDPGEVEKHIESAKSLMARAADARRVGNESEAANLEAAAQTYAIIAVAEGIRSLLSRGTTGSS
jgi:hypothetical protein